MTATSPARHRDARGTPHPSATWIVARRLLRSYGPLALLALALLLMALFIPSEAQGPAENGARPTEPHVVLLSEPGGPTRAS